MLVIGTGKNICMHLLEKEHLTSLLQTTTSRNSSVGTATGWTAGVQFLAGARDVPLLHSIQRAPGPHPDS
jgi:hypothetical protein